MALLKTLILIFTTISGIGLVGSLFRQRRFLLGTLAVVLLIAWVSAWLWWILRKPRPKLQRYRFPFRHNYKDTEFESIDPALEQREVFEYARERQWPYLDAATGIGSLKTLIFQDINHYWYSEPLGFTDDDYAMMGRAQALENIVFAGTELDDGALQHIARAPRLQGIEAQISEVTDAGIAAIAQVPNLRMIHFKKSQHVSMAAWQQLLSKPGLTEIIFEELELRDEVFEGLRGSTTLTKLELKNIAGLTDRLFEILATLPNLDSLVFWDRKSDRVMTPRGVLLLLRQRMPTKLRLRPESIDDQVWKIMVSRGWLYGPHGKMVYKQERPPLTPEEVNTIDLDETLVGDEGFALVADCVNAETVAFSKSRITDVSMKRLVNFKRLRYLTLSRCNITARGLLGIVDAPLNFVRLDETVLTEDCFKVLGRNQSLADIHLDQAKMRGVWIRHLAGMPNLNQLLIAGQQLTMEDIEAIASLRNVKKLSFQRSNLDNAGFAKIFSMPQLESLSVDKTQVSESLCEKARAKRPNLRIFSG